MSQPTEPSSIYQLRIVLREISPLIWRRLLVCSDTTLAHVHTILGGVLKVEICFLRKSTSFCFQSGKTSGFYRHLHF